MCNSLRLFSLLKCAHTFKNCFFFIIFSLVEAHNYQNSVIAYFFILNRSKKLKKKGAQTFNNLVSQVNFAPEVSSNYTLLPNASELILQRSQLELLRHRTSRVPETRLTFSAQMRLRLHSSLVPVALPCRSCGFITSVKSFYWPLPLVWKA